MKLCIVATLVVVAAATPAFADDGDAYPNIALNSNPTSNSAPVSSEPIGSRSSNSASSGKTREEVREELIQAYRDGLLPTNKNDYPPSPATIARNKELFRLANPKWGTAN
ncbi:DUF4148 domain-containing protein [Burkholderia territorii]|uniref:DUF4148 domain-containing protein n=1 Tax=Burkholderia territorii TaxID=1503055 RepID=UPI0012D8CAB1|nr:DUF4148 domain-containing protein [Burkholderia territorii]